MPSSTSVGTMPKTLPELVRPIQLQNDRYVTFKQAHAHFWFTQVYPHAFGATLRPLIVLARTRNQRTNTPRRIAYAFPRRENGTTSSYPSGRESTSCVHQHLPKRTNLPSLLPSVVLAFSWATACTRGVGGGTNTRSLSSQSSWTSILSTTPSRKK
jgi:hypothetical protein